MLHAAVSENKRRANAPQIAGPGRDSDSHEALFTPRAAQSVNSTPWSRVHRVYGNQAVLRMLGEPGRIRRKCASCASCTSTCTGCAAEQKLYQRRLAPAKRTATTQRDIANQGNTPDAGNKAAAPPVTGADTNDKAAPMSK